LSIFAPFALFPTYSPYGFIAALLLKIAPTGVIPPTLRTINLKFLMNKKAEEDNKNMFTNKHIQQLQALAMQQAA